VIRHFPNYSIKRLNELPEINQEAWPDLGGIADKEEDRCRSIQPQQAPRQK
jgi:hypothetical protein